MKHINLIIDVDAGADDLLALTLALLHPQINVLGIITSYGNFIEKDTYSRIVSLLNKLKLKKNPPVIRGAYRPLKRSFQASASIHGSAYINSDMSESFLQKFNQQHNFKKNLLKILDHKNLSIQYVNLGPLTNLSRLIDDKIFKNKISGITIMGGALHFPGNATPTAEANFYWDPEAAKKVLSSSLPISLVPLNITEQIQLTVQRVKQFKDLKFFTPILSPYIDYYRNIKKLCQLPPDFKSLAYQGAAIHDVLTIVSFLEKNIINFQPITISTQHLTTIRGMIAPLDRNEQLKHSMFHANLKVAVKINSNKFWKIFDSYFLKSKIGIS